MQPTIVSEKYFNRIRLGWHAWFQGWYRRKKRFPVSSELVAM